MAPAAVSVAEELLQMTVDAATITGNAFTITVAVVTAVQVPVLPVIV